MNKSDSDELSRDEQEVARLLRAAGTRQELPTVLRQKWEQQFRGELRPVLKQRRRRRHAIMGLCAGIAALGLTTLLSYQAPVPPQFDVSVVRVSGDTELTTRETSKQTLSAGQSLSVDDAVSTGTAGYASLDYQGYSIRLNSETRLQLLPEGIALLSGEIYVSDEGQNTAIDGIKVVTHLGTIKDIGTQFTVKLHGERLVSSVRRGTIVLHTQSEDYRAEAGPDTARKITFSNTEPAQLGDLAPNGPEWEWIYRSAPEFILEGQTVAAFLDWASRESGLRLQYASKSAEIYAQTTLLHGEVQGIEPDRVIEPVIATTHLNIERGAANNLRVSLPPRS